MINTHKSRAFHEIRRHDFFLLRKIRALGMALVLYCKQTNYMLICYSDIQYLF